MYEQCGNIADAWQLALQADALTKNISIFPAYSPQALSSSRQEIFQLALKIKAVLSNSLEIPRYKRIGLVAHVNPYFIPACHAIWLGQHSLVIINPSMSQTDLLTTINNAEVDTLIFPPQHATSLIKLIKGAGSIRQWVMTEGAGFKLPGLNFSILKDLINETTNTQVCAANDESEIDFPALISFTNGFTGRVSGVSFSQQQLLTAAHQLAQHLELAQTPNKAIVSFLNPEHICATQLSCLLPLVCTNNINIADPVHANNDSELLGRFNDSHIFVNQQLIYDFDPSRYVKTTATNNQSLVHVLTSQRLNSEATKAFSIETGFPTYACYQNSEAGGFISVVPSKIPEELHMHEGLDCCGKLIPGINVSANNEQQLTLKSKQVMRKYESTSPGDCKLVDATTVHTTDQGLLHTTEAGDTWLYISSRSESLQATREETCDTEEHWDEPEAIEDNLQEVDEPCSAAPQQFKQDPDRLSELPPDLTILQQLHQLSKNDNADTHRVAQLCNSDPVLIVELIRLYQFASERSHDRPLQDLKDIIVLLGPSLINELCEQLLDREQFNDPTTCKWLQQARTRCLQAGEIAKLLAVKLRASSPEEARLSALLKEIGDFHFITMYPKQYVKLAEELPRVKLVYQLSKQHKFHPDNTAVTFLKRMQCPNNLMKLIDPEIKVSASKEASLKMICKAAAEITELIAQDNLDRIEPGKQLSSRSSLRLLQIPENAYKDIYEGILQILAQPQEEPEEIIPAEPVEETEIIEIEPEEDLTIEEQETEEESPEPVVEQLDSESNNETEEIKVAEPETIQKTALPTNRIQVPKTRSNTTSSNVVITDAIRILNEVSDIMVGIEEIMQSLTSKSPFSRIALLLVSVSEKNVRILESINLDIGGEKDFPIEESLSPFLIKEVQIYSFSKRGRHNTKFQSMTYAMGPISISKNEMLMLYADCGPNEVLPFASRRLFRQLITLLKKEVGDILTDETTEAGIVSDTQ